ncbi:MAG TPA: transposase [Candidatus Nitrosocosmicus sp.]|nr:transposase [Candidatus Nitrosocosmicus sp.]
MSIMQTPTTRVDKATFKQIFRDYGEAFWQRYGHYFDANVREVVDKMLGCGDQASGYSTYRCEHCHEVKRVAFSCKSSFCLSCCKVYIDEWVSHIGQTLYEGVPYRHVVLTVPDVIRMPFFHDRSLLADLMKCGVQMLNEALSWFKKVTLEVGYVVVLETAGRAGNWNPHLHILMTSGGVTRQDRWRALTYFPYDELHKRWQYHLLTMLKAGVPTPEMKRQIATLWQQYPDGLVAYLEDGKVPAGGQGLAYYLAKYVVSPPISLRRLLSYDGQHVRYWYNDHKSGKRQVAELPVLRFIGRMVQHILPKGFHRIRYYGLHATCKHQRVKSLLKTIWVAVGRAIKGTYRVVRRQSYQERVLASTGRDPLRCPRCGGSMMLWQIWHPRYGVVYDEVEQIKRGRYDPGGGVLPGANVAEERRDSGDQLGWSFIGMGEAIRDDYEGCAWGVEPSLL